MLCHIAMNSKVYRWCAVPQCINTSIKTPKKIFINVPMKRKVRNEWLNLARRDPTDISSNSVIYFCEDHFDLSNDMENYIQYHVMGSVSQVRMKSGCAPTRFECQLDKRKLPFSTRKRLHVLKKQKKTFIEESEKNLTDTSTSRKYLETAGSSSAFASSYTIEEQQNGSTAYPKLAEKSLQVHIPHKFRSILQTDINFVNQFTLTMKPDCCSISTFPFKIESCGSSKSKESNLFNTSNKTFTVEDQSYIDSSYTSSIQESLPSTQYLQVKPTSDCSELTEDKKKEETSEIVKYTLHKIMKNPHSYIDLPKTCCYLSDLIEEQKSLLTI